MCTVQCAYLCIQDVRAPSDLELQYFSNFVWHNFSLKEYFALILGRDATPLITNK